MVNVFNVEIFFVVFRETLEAVIVVSVLLAFIKQGLSEDETVYKRLRKQIWIGAISGFLICLILGCAFIGAFYSLGKDVWAKSEDLWEGIFCVIATVMISLMGIPMLRINKMQTKWRLKLARALVVSKNEKKGRFAFGHWTKKYAMFLLPFVTTLREGLEAVVFIGGVGLGSPATSFPIPVIVGLIAGISVGVLLYYSGSTLSLQVFLCISTAILYLIAAGLFSRAIWFFETYKYNQKTGGDASENGSGPGTYDIKTSVWHVNCCNPETDNGWDIFNALLGWQNSATYGSVIGYNIYWLAVMITLYLLWFEEKNNHLPFMKNLKLRQLNPLYWMKGKNKKEVSKEDQEKLFEQLKSKEFANKLAEE
ncbi:Iron permease [Komagataella phaffii CBS 7435]|uniref:High affinity iron permease involved in the transport of iron across the plasma membrane n=3 Tax=Komagataella TaxID=460517 RepID=C4QX98_KOMPG|nr:High affinity iron permease involved in the transport of iron across the plasma membrane [Komagataella phaffii GS115]AOA60481.1 GQ67_02148T0 [Komagataella phaffii]CAH2446681.1 Iron permease [Komagataella phaffii CBS 7435]CAI77629.1 Ftr1 protein [Komagataella pastoris]AOA66661.1 GQ68_02163T0 [Komagataella phaffii GS115]CAY67871.1 High affinity iron permease involved in the transport of iron across the plasma membrane [Komagataella phaffii GS115]